MTYIPWRHSSFSFGERGETLNEAVLDLVAKRTPDEWFGTTYESMVEYVKEHYGAKLAEDYNNNKTWQGMAPLDEITEYFAQAVLYGCRVMFANELISRGIGLKAEGLKEELTKPWFFAQIAIAKATIPDFLEEEKKVAARYRQQLEAQEE